MTTIVKRITKGTILTVAELDANVANLNSTKLEVAGGTLTGLPVLATQDIDIISPVYPTTKPSLNLDFTRGQLDPRVTFARNSTAAYYDGKSVAKAEENLLLYSQDFSQTAWTKPNSSVAGGNTAPDTSSTAYKLVINNAAGVGTGYIIQSITGIAFTNTGILFNLTTGLIGSYIVGTFDSTPTCTSVGNSWYRCTVFKNGYHFSVYAKASEWSSICIQVVGTQMAIYPSNTSTAITGTGDGTSGVYLWGAQLEQRSSVTAYTPTTTAPITNYIPVMKFAPANVPRFDYDPITGKPLGLLIEEGRSNLLSYSSNMGAWGRYSNGTGSLPVVINNAAIAPDGTLTASQVTFNCGAGTTASDSTTLEQIGSANGATIGTTYTSSVWIKGIAGVKLQIRQQAASGYSVFTLTGGWDRLIQTEVGAINFVDLSIGIRQGIVGTINSNITVLIWGAQLEVGSFATSYIPTTTTAVGRQPDQASMVGTNFSSWYNQNEGSLYCEGDTIYVPTTPGIPAIAPSQFMLADIGGLNGISVNIVNATSNSLRALITGSTIYTAILASPTTVANVICKDAVTYTATNLSAYRNGISSASTSLATHIAVINNLTIGVSLGYRYLNGHIKKLTYYPKALPSTELVALTS